jgi:hypothetical protein
MKILFLFLFFFVNQMFAITLLDAQEIDQSQCYSRNLGRYDNNLERFEKDQEAVLACLKDRVQVALMCESTMHPDSAFFISFVGKEEAKSEVVYLPSYNVRINNDQKIVEEFELEDNWGYGVIFYIEEISSAQQTLLLGDIYLIRNFDAVGTKYMFLRAHSNWVITTDPDDVFNDDLTEKNDPQNIRRFFGSLEIDRESGKYIVGRDLISGDPNDEGICEVAKRDNYSSLWGILTNIARLTKKNAEDERLILSNKLKF